MARRPSPCLPPSSTPRWGLAWPALSGLNGTPPTRCCSRSNARPPQLAGCPDIQSNARPPQLAGCPDRFACSPPPSSASMTAYSPNIVIDGRPTCARSIPSPRCPLRDRPRAAAAAYASVCAPEPTCTLTLAPHLPNQALHLPNEAHHPLGPPHLPNQALHLPNQAHHPLGPPHLPNQALHLPNQACTAALTREALQLTPWATLPPASPLSTRQ